MSVYVVVVIENEYDIGIWSALGCATFSELKTAQAYAKRKAEDRCKDLKVDESEIDVSDNGDCRVYDERYSCYAIQCTIIESNVDAYMKYAHNVETRHEG